MKTTSQLFIIRSVVSLIAIGLALPAAQAGVHFEILKAFSRQDEFGNFWQLPQPDRWNPQNGVIEGSDGVFYGTTSGEQPESSNGGTVFKINKDGTGYKVLH